MGIFSTSTPFDSDVDKITDEKNTSEDWGTILDLCDRVQNAPNGPRDCLKSITKRLQHQDPHVVIQAITLLDACVNNCGKAFKLEVASASFEADFKKLLAKWKVEPRVHDKLKSMLKKWAENDFKGEPQLALIPALYSGLMKGGVDFRSQSEPGKHKGHTTQQPSSNPNVVSSQQEEDDIAKAIQLSLADSKTPSSQKARPSSSAQQQQQALYPTAAEFLAQTSSYQPQQQAQAAPPAEQKKARALYDFEAAEDNELTFKTGEIVIILDDSDANWWKGSNHRGEGLFPANFVTTDLEGSPQKEEGRQGGSRRRSVQFNEEVEVKTVDATQPVCLEISEDKIDKVLNMLNEADPTAPESGDPPELAGAEEGVINSMAPLIDTELEKIDRRHAQLTRISTELVDALNLYHQLMHEVPPGAAAAAGGGAAYGMPPAGPVAPGGYPGYGAPPHMMPPHQQQMYGGVPHYDPNQPHLMNNGGTPMGAPPPPQVGGAPAYPGSPQHAPYHHHPYPPQQPPMASDQQQPQQMHPQAASYPVTTAPPVSNGADPSAAATVGEAPAMTHQVNPAVYSQAPTGAPPPMQANSASQIPPISSQHFNAPPSTVQQSNQIPPPQQQPIHPAAPANGATPNGSYPQMGIGSAAPPIGQT